MAFDWAFLWSIVPALAEAAQVTIAATVLGFVVALVLGLVFAVLRRSRARWIAWPVAAIVEFVRSTPLLVQLYFMFFVLPEYGIVLPALLIGILGLGVHYATYTSEVYRAGLDNIPSGQWEAAAALNFSPWRVYRSVILPQAIPPIVPALGNYLIAMFKDTPLLSAIAVVELMQRAKIIGSETFRYLEPVTAVGAFFLVLSLLSAAAVRQVERRTSSERRIARRPEVS